MSGRPRPNPSLHKLCPLGPFRTSRIGSGWHSPTVPRRRPARASLPRRRRRCSASATSPAGAFKTRSARVVRVSHATAALTSPSPRDSRPQRSSALSRPFRSFPPHSPSCPRHVGRCSVRISHPYPETSTPPNASSLSALVSPSLSPLGRPRNSCEERIRLFLRPTQAVAMTALLPRRRFSAPSTHKADAGVQEDIRG